MSLELTIVTPQGEAFRGPIESVVLPGSEGDFGVLPQHERLLTALREGEVEIKTSAGTRKATISEPTPTAGVEFMNGLYGSLISTTAKVPLKKAAI